MAARGKIVYAKDGPKYYIEGKEVTAKQFDKALPHKGYGALPIVGSHSGWPRVSRALGVHPKQVGQMRETLKAHGYDPQQVRSDGKLEIRSQKQQREFVKFFNRNRAPSERIVDFDD